MEAGRVVVVVGGGVRGDWEVEIKNFSSEGKHMT